MTDKHENYLVFAYDTCSGDVINQIQKKLREVQKYRINQPKSKLYQ